jgi:hypothetical protein
MAAHAFTSGNFEVSCPHGFAADNAPPGLTELCAAASATGVQRALMITVCAGFLASAAYFASAFTLRRALVAEPAAADQTGR